MIKPNELRIGNLLDWHCDNLCAGEGYVAEINEQGFRFVGNNGCHPHGDEYDEIKPIPLTPEWLDHLDIKYSDGLGYSYPFAENFNLYLTKRVFKSVECTIMQYSEGDERLAHIEYVHQFQNLYFALTGKELEIKK